MRIYISVKKAAEIFLFIVKRFLVLVRNTTNFTGE